MTTKAEVQAVLESRPTLGCYGFAPYKYKGDIFKDRESLLGQHGLQEIDISRQWLSTLPRQKRAKPRGSYELKHELDHEIGFYVGNGSLIVGAILLGLPTEKEAWYLSPNGIIRELGHRRLLPYTERAITHAEAVNRIGFVQLTLAQVMHSRQGSTKDRILTDTEVADYLKEDWLKEFLFPKK